MPSVSTFLERFDDVKAAQAANADELTEFFRDHQVVRRSAIARRLQQIQTASPPLTEDEAIVVPAKALTLGLITLLKVVLAHLAEFNQQIAELFESLPDAELFQSWPGAGPHLAPRLLAAFGEDRSRFRLAQAFMCDICIAPVQEESGKKCWVHWRWSCPMFLRQTFRE